MKTGRSLSDLAREIERQATVKNDYLANTRALTMLSGEDLALEMNQTTQVLGVNDVAHGQIAEYLDIPGKFYKRLRSEYKAQFDDVVNAMFARRATNRMVRTLDGKVRGFLSDRYRRRDNIDLMEYILPQMMNYGDLNIVSCEITETRLYLKFTSTQVRGEVKLGDVVEAGGIITNSEVGFAATSVFPFLNRLRCLNGMVLNDFGQRRYHIGKRIEQDGEAMELFSDATLEADDKAFWMKVADTVRAVVDPQQFQVLLNRLRETTEQPITGNPEKVVEVLSNRYLLNKDQKQSVLRHLIDDGNGLTAWGMANAVTSAAGEQEDYNEATRLEGIGGNVVTLAPHEWQTLAVAA